MLGKAVSIVIPTYNEKDNIVPLIQRINNAMAGYDYEVVFIDDNSADGTADLVRSLSSQYPAKVVVRKDKRGLASAVIDGLGYVSSRTVVVMDADLQHPPEVIPALVREIMGGADIVTASRYCPGGSCPQDWGVVRKLLSRGAIMLAHALLPATRKSSDPMSGFFAFNQDVVDGAQLNPIGYKILLEVLMEGKFQRAAEVPYHFDTRSGGESKLSSRQQIEYLKQLYTLMKQKGELLRFLKFCAVGLSGVLVNEGLLWLLTEIAGLYYRLSGALSYEASIISNFVLNDYFTFPDRRSKEPFWKRLLKFNAVSLGGWAINQCTLWFFTEIVRFHYRVSNLIGIAIATMWNYVINTWWTWK